MRNRMSIVFIMVLSLLSCVDEFEIKDNNYRELLVVEGTISNALGPYVIKLSTSASLEQIINKPKSDCVVSVIDNEGNAYPFVESGMGVYQSQGLQAEVGKSYKLLINTPEGDAYETAFQEVKVPVEIDRVYDEYREVDDVNRTLPRFGVQFYVDSKRPENDSTYLIWELEETYKYSVDFFLTHYWDGKLNEFPKPDSFFTCYRTVDIPRVYTHSTENQSIPEISRKELNYVDTQTKRLMHRYSLLVKQTNVSKACYQYFERLNEVNDDQSSPFTQQPYQVIGNVFNTDENKPDALGYFIVGGVDEQRVFLTWLRGKYEYPECEITEPDMILYARISATRPSRYPVYVVTSDAGARAVVSAYCYDCRTEGGTIEKPDWWID